MKPPRKAMHFYSSIFWSEVSPNQTTLLRNAPER